MENKEQTQIPNETQTANETQTTNTKKENFMQSTIESEFEIINDTKENNFNIDDKIIEFQNKLDKIITFKNDGNTLFKSQQFDEAIEKYSKAKELFVENDKLFSDFLQKPSEKEENLKNLQKSYIKEKVAIMSNLALIHAKNENFESSVENDLKVNYIKIILLILKLQIRL
jgi:tetratricopeptide (TPR) repeat protein